MLKLLLPLLLLLLLLKDIRIKLEFITTFIKTIIINIELENCLFITTE